jgi:HEAT repeat protein/lysophospholipase L1-like esterase
LRLRDPGQSLPANLALATAAFIVFGAMLEGGARLLERSAPAPREEGLIWNWKEGWGEDFYTLASDPSTWPPWRRINSEGLRDRARPQQRAEGEWRVAVLGDSVTFGDGIKPREAFPQELEAKLQDAGRAVEVMSVALPGWSTRQHVIAYRRIVRRYRPDEVLLAVCLNDITELEYNLRPPPRWIGELHRRSALVRRLVDAPGLEIRSVEKLFRGGAALDRALAMFFAELGALVDDTAADRVPFAVVVLPFQFQTQPGAPPPVVQERIAAFCAARKLRCLDLLPALVRFGPNAFRDHDHLTPAGSAFVADRILEAGLIVDRPAAPELLANRLGGRGPWPPALLVDALGASDPQVRAAAAWACARLPRSEVGPVVPALAARLGDPVEAVRTAAARALGAAGEASRPASPALFAALGDTSEAVRFEAAVALEKVRPYPELARPALVQALASPHRYVREFAAWTLGNMGEEAGEAVPALVEALSRPEAFTDAGAAAALGRIGAPAAAAVPALVSCLSSPDPEVRWRAARSLGEIGPAAHEAKPALRHALGDGDEKVRTHAGRALARMVAPARAAR